MEGKLFVVIVLCVAIAHSQPTSCNSRTGLPTCFLFPGGNSYPLESSFLNGVGSQHPGAEIVTNVNTGTAGNVALFDVNANCGAIFLTATNVAFTLSAADLANIQAYYNSGGIIIVACELVGYAPNCASSINPIIPLIDPTVQVQFAANDVGTGGVCTTETPTSTGATHELFTNPSTVSIPNIRGCSFTYPTNTDPECLAELPGTSECVFAQDGGFIFTGDSVLFQNTPAFSGCTPNPTLVGGNFGAYMASCGSIGGDPHLQGFSSSKIVSDLPFENGKKYEFYGNRGFRVVIETISSYITSVGIKLESHELLATLVDQEPRFYLNGELIVGSFSTPFGNGELFDPQSMHFVGELAELARYQTLGLKIGNFIEIVGGIHPQSGGFFNLEVARAGRRLGEFGLLAGLKNHDVRDTTFLSKFETESLF